MPMPIEIREFEPEDHAAVLDLWRGAPGVVIRDVDALAPITAYLAKNPGMSFVAVTDGAIVGAVLCGTDGRRGYLHHLAVHPKYRRQGIGRRLADRSLRALVDIGIDKCHLMVLTDNRDALRFWSHVGWQTRSDIHVMSYTSSGVATA
jgi:ribosomal protein S18 acetylase RimI-like enzyme